MATTLADRIVKGPFVLRHWTLLLRRQNGSGEKKYSDATARCVNLESLLMSYQG